jgi:hypothetical protein
VPLVKLHTAEYTGELVTRLQLLAHRRGNIATQTLSHSVIAPYCKRTRVGTSTSTSTPFSISVRPFSGPHIILKEWFAKRKASKPTDFSANSFFTFKCKSCVRCQVIKRPTFVWTIDILFARTVFTFCSDTLQIFNLLTWTGRTYSHKECYDNFKIMKPCFVKHKETINASMYIYMVFNTTCFDPGGSSPGYSTR